MELENIAVRSNGKLLLTALGSNAIREFDPATPNNTRTLTPFPGVSALLGIAEVSPDLFAVVGGNLSRTGTQPGSFAVFAIDVSKRPAIVSTITALPDAATLNGAAAIPPQPGTHGNSTILVSDTGTGALTQIDPTTGETGTIAIPEVSVSGLNGIRFVSRKSTLFFSNTISALFGSVELSIAYNTTARLPTITPAAARILATEVNGDDFALTGNGTAFVCANPLNAVFRVDASGAMEVIRTPDLVAPSSGVFGGRPRDAATLYITSLGPVSSVGNQTVSQGGQLFAFTPSLK